MDQQDLNDLLAFKQSYDKWPIVARDYNGALPDGTYVKYLGGGLGIAAGGRTIPLVLVCEKYEEAAKLK